MSYRIGKCSDCGAGFKVPASFQADRAKCKKCGGVVEIGEVQTEAPPVPAKKVVQEEPKPKRSGPSMKERLLAQRQAEAAAKPAAKRAAKPASKPSARKQRPVADEVEDEPRRRSGSTGSRRSAPARSRRGGRKRDEEEEPDEEEHDHGRRSSRSRGGRRKQSGPPAGVGLIAIGLVVVAGIAGFFIMGMEDDATDDPAGQGPTEEQLAAEQAASVFGDVADVDPDAVEDDGADEVVDEPEDEPEPEPEPDQPREPRSPDLVDLSIYEPFGTPNGCTDARFAELQVLAALLVDPEAGAAGGRAGTKLETEGKFAIPAILNEMLNLDLADDDGFRSGDVCQKTLQRICNGNNFGWYYQGNDEWHYLNKRVIERWLTTWEKANEDEAFWLKVAKLEGTAPEKPTDDAGTPADDADDLDDI